MFSAFAIPAPYPDTGATLDMAAPRRGEIRIPTIARRACSGRTGHFHELVPQKKPGQTVAEQLGNKPRSPSRKAAMRETIDPKVESTSGAHSKHTESFHYSGYRQLPVARRIPFFRSRREHNSRTPSPHVAQRAEPPARSPVHRPRKASHA